MKQYGTNELRKMYLDFFEKKEHLVMKSYSLVPKNDNSLLLINAGMAPLKPYFTGVEKPPKNRITTCQKCIRTGDIENVGKTSRHGTFFEMLGNFSFGDYFKAEIIPWAWEFITEILEMPKDKLYVTIYLDDDEAYDIWKEKTDVDPKRIFRLGKEDNFWEHGAGPCGPCTEIHFDRGEGLNVIKTAEEFIKAGDEDRVIEFWNLVFTQFDGDGKGNYEKLAKTNIDTGMGLERIATIMQGVDNIFEIDTVKNILGKVTELSGSEYGKDKNKDISLRIITDHVKSVTMMLADGVSPSNIGRGYVLRRLLRRAARHGRVLGINGVFLGKVVDSVVENYGVAYPEILEKQEYIKKMITIEEESFNKTIDAGISILREYIDEVKSKNEDTLPGEYAFKLYDTYGFPYELTEEICEEKQINMNREDFEKLMEEQRTRTRNEREVTSYMGSDEVPINKIDADIETKFEGYTSLNIEDKVLVLADDRSFRDSLIKGENGYVVTGKTPFYAEMGGQIGDKGILYNNNFKAEVYNTKKNVGGKTIHYIKVVEGEVKKNDTINMQVDVKRRKSIAKNHTATHMLQSALQEIVGDHTHQAGSFVDDERLRFDFNHFQPLTMEEIIKIEDLVNEKIMEVDFVKTDLMTLDEAKKAGAMALFDDKYENKVRVVSVGDFSKELCGGTHVGNSGEIGLFKIISESGVASGVRRIEAITGFNAIKYIDNKETLLKDACKVLKCNEKDITSKLEAINIELKDKEKEIIELRGKLTSGSLDEIINSSKDVKGIKVISYSIDGVDGNSLRELCDKVRDKIQSGVVVLISNCDGKVNICSMATKDVIEKGIHSGKIIKDVASTLGGGGGGRPDMAQAGGKKPENIKEALEKVYEIVKNLVK